MDSSGHPRLYKKEISMSTIQNYLITVSFLGWAILLLVQFIRNKQNKRYWISSGIQLALILIIAKVLNRSVHDKKNEK
jgi:hypothetical protein